MNGLEGILVSVGDQTGGWLYQTKARSYTIRVHRPWPGGKTMFLVEPTDGSPHGYWIADTVGQLCRDRDLGLPLIHVGRTDV